MGLLDLFRRKTDREKYDAASRELEHRGEILDRAGLRLDQRDDYGGPYSNRGFDSDFGMDTDLDKFDRAKANYNRAKKRLDKLYDKSHSKAIKLNKQYDILVSKLGKDAEEVYKFEKDKLGMHKNKESKLVTITSIIGLVGGIFFLSPNLTGNVIGNLTQPSSDVIGTVLLVIGLIGGFFWFRSRRR